MEESQKLSASSAECENNSLPAVECTTVTKERRKEDGEDHLGPSFKATERATPIAEARVEKPNSTLGEDSTKLSTVEEGEQQEKMKKPTTEKNNEMDNTAAKMDAKRLKEPGERVSKSTKEKGIVEEGYDHPDDFSDSEVEEGISSTIKKNERKRPLTKSRRPLDPGKLYKLMDLIQENLVAFSSVGVGPSFKYTDGIVEKPDFFLFLNKVGWLSENESETSSSSEGRGSGSGNSGQTEPMSGASTRSSQYLNPEDYNLSEYHYRTLMRRFVSRIPGYRDHGVPLDLQKVLRAKIDSYGKKRWGFQLELRRRHSLARKQVKLAQKRTDGLFVAKSSVDDKQETGGNKTPIPNQNVQQEVYMVPPQYQQVVQIMPSQNTQNAQSQSNSIVLLVPVGQATNVAQSQPVYSMVQQTPHSQPVLQPIYHHQAPVQSIQYASSGGSSEPQGSAMSSLGSSSHGSQAVFVAEPTSIPVQFTNMHPPIQLQQQVPTNQPANVAVAGNEVQLQRIEHVIPTAAAAPVNWVAMNPSANGGAHTWSQIPKRAFGNFQYPQENNKRDSDQDPSLQ